MNRRIISFYTTILLSVIMIYSCCNKEKPIEIVVNEALDFSLEQSKLMAQSLIDEKDRLPQTTDRFGKLHTCKSGWWVSGFFPGVLWYLYENSGDAKVKAMAREYTSRVEKEQYTTSNHDVGFIINCSFGNGYRLTENKTYGEVMYNASESLATRFNNTIGCIRSWDYADWSKKWQYPVIIDNMMNLELLMWTAKEFNNKKFKSIAISHSDKTLQNHYRKNFSSFHVVSYDTISGQPEKKNTAQGYSDKSSWARGQGWGLYGFTMMYRFTNDVKYLKHAENIADYIINHPNFPDDGIPFWDFNAPNIPDCYRDASAGAIICSALIELSQYTKNRERKINYLKIAERQLRTLSSSEYLNALGNNGNFILKHSVGHMPNNTEVDVSLTYADYYYVEALVRYKNLKGF